MTPYYFRGLVLITEDIISYSEFMKMTYKDFSRLEAFTMFKNDYRKNKESKAKHQKTKAQLSGLNTIDINKLGFTDEQLKSLYQL